MIHPRIIKIGQNLFWCEFNKMTAAIDPKTGGLVFLEDIVEEQKALMPDINAHFNPQPSSLTLQERFELVRSVGEECIQPEELMNVLKTKEHPICYDGFEPSGRMHIAQGVLKSILVNKLTSAGCIFVFWVADWFALLNNKMGGDLDKIQTTGKYLIETWKAAGMNMSNVKFLWASEEINNHSNDYWMRVIDIARKFHFNRISRCSQIMGRDKKEELSIAQLLYPCMQCSDIFFLDCDICQLGMDQRKVNVLAREYCDALHKKEKPVILSHHMLMGLGHGQEKMSKSDPNSAIFMEDSHEDLVRKVNLAFCEEGDITTNPILDYTQHIVFPKNGELLIERPEKWGGNKLYTSFEELQSDFANKLLHPGDLKPAFAKALDQMLEPVRTHFEQDPYARDLLKKVRSFRVTK